MIGDAVEDGDAVGIVVATGDGAEALDAVGTDKVIGDVVEDADAVEIQYADADQFGYADEDRHLGEDCVPFGKRLKLCEDERESKGY